MRVLLTGVAGFIGFHLARDLLARGYDVLGVDNLNAYYDPQLKRDRLAELHLGMVASSEENPAVFQRGRSLLISDADIADAAMLESAAGTFNPDVIVHLAAQAGVRYSLENPVAYVDANVRGHANILEYARRQPSLKQVVYASSSSVYGNRSDVPFRETDRCDNPASIYAATKRAGELLSQTYANLYGLSLTGLRFFTVYGPWGRPDMAYWSFTEALLAGKPIRLFNEGRMRRDFTDIRDVVAGLVSIIEAKPDPGHAIYNIGHSQPVELSRFLAALENATGRRANAELAPMQPGDVGDTFADVSKLEKRFGVKPQIAIEDGLREFVSWYRGYKGV